MRRGPHGKQLFWTLWLMSTGFLLARNEAPASHASSIAYGIRYYEGVDCSPFYANADNLYYSEQWSNRWDDIVDDWRDDGFDCAIRRALSVGVGLKEISKAAADTAVRIALDEVEGNLKQAAQRLGVTDRALQLRRANNHK